MKEKCASPEERDESTPRAEQFEGVVVVVVKLSLNNGTVSLLSKSSLSK